MRDLLVHDMRTPLAIISGYTQMLRRRAVKSRPRLGDLIQDLESIEAAAKRAERMLDELARLAAGETVASHGSQRQPVDLIARGADFGADMCARPPAHYQANRAGRLSPGQTGPSTPTSNGGMPHEPTATHSKSQARVTRSTSPGRRRHRPARWWPHLDGLHCRPSQASQARPGR